MIAASDVQWTSFNPLCAGKGPEGPTRRGECPGRLHVSIPSVRGRALKARIALIASNGQTSFNPLCAGKGPEGGWDQPMTALQPGFNPLCAGKGPEGFVKSLVLLEGPWFQSPLCGEGP